MRWAAGHVVKRNGGDYWEYLGIDGTIILKWNLRELDCRL
jgi:hypothetical protein